MLSTMPKDGAAPTSPNAMPGGLGAILQQPGGAPKGASSRSIASIMDTARKMSDMQLADVLSGKSLDVPQYVAMTEAMGRKSLRTAMQGQQAQQQAKQPSVKDRLLAEEAQATQMAQAPQGGIDQLPAPNMAPEGMAGGGIVAFDEGGEVPRFNEGGTPLTPEQVQQLLTRGSIRRSEEDIKKDLADQPYFGSQRMRPYRDAAANALNEAAANAPKTTTAQAMSQDMQEGRKSSAPAAAPSAPAGGPTQAQRDAFYEKATPKASAEPQGLDAAYAAAQAKSRAGADEQYAKFADTGNKTRSGIAGLKNEAQSQILLDAMSALMGNRNLAEAGGKFGTLAAGRVGAMGKESRALEKEANDFDFNMAKAKEAAASGNMKAYNEYIQNADLAKYHGMMGKAALMNASATANAPENKMGIAVGNKVMEDVQKRLKDDVRFRNDWNKMSPQEQAAYYQQQYNIASSVYSGKMDPAVFGGPKVALSKEQMDLVNKYK